MEHPITPPTLEQEVAHLKARVDFLESRLNNWVNQKDATRAHRRVSAPKDAPRLFASKYEGTCVTCGARIHKGDQIHWTRVDGQSVIWCEDCETPAEAR